MNPVLLQKQLKDNAKDIQEFCNDLQNWGDEMKRKEDSLKNPQNTTGKKSKVSVAQIKEITPKTTSLTTDYSKWEKYNADLECERLEDDYKDDSELTDEFEDTKRDESLVHKEKGNMFVKQKNWDKAIEYYTKAINCFQYDPIFYANRALCNLKKGDFIKAEEDCTLSLRLDSTYVKALQRRAAAREGLGKLNLALSDLELVLNHEPKNKESQGALERIKKLVKSDQESPISKFKASKKMPFVTKENFKIDESNAISSFGWPDPGCEIVPVKAIKKPVHLRSKKPLKRIEIVEVGPNQIEAVKKHVTENKFDFMGAGEPMEKCSVFKKNREKFKNEEINKNGWPKSSMNIDIIKSDDIKVFEKKPKEIKNTENISITKTDNNSLKCLLPKTSVQFYSTWKTLKTPQEKYEYLKLLEPKEIPNIFRESLESNVFSDILDILSNHFVKNNDEVYEFLHKLTEVKRFAALAMFMDSRDKNHLWKLITYMREKSVDNEQVNNLVQLYEL